MNKNKLTLKALHQELEKIKKANQKGNISSRRGSFVQEVAPITVNFYHFYYTRKEKLIKQIF